MCAENANADHINYAWTVGHNSQSKTQCTELTTPNALQVVRGFADEIIATKNSLITWRQRIKANARRIRDKLTAGEIREAENVSFTLCATD